MFRAIQQGGGLRQRVTADVESVSHKALKGLLRLEREGRDDALIEEVLNEARRCLESGTGFNAFDWVAKHGLEGAYLTLQRLLSSYAHGSLSMMDRYVVPDEAGRAERVTS